MSEALSGKKLALLTWGKDQSGDEEVWLHTGMLVWDGENLVMDRGPDKAFFAVRPEWIDRIRPSRSDLGDILGDADLILSLTVEALPDDADLSEFKFTGLVEPPS